MSSTVPFNQWVFPSLGSAGPIDPRLTWPLAGSFVLHVVMVSAAIMSVRFLPAVESPEQSYHVTLVTLPERRSSHKTTSRADLSRTPATPPARPSAPVATPQPSVHKTEKVVDATVPPSQSKPSFSRAAIPLKVPQLAAEEPVFQKQEPPVRSATEAGPAAESLARAIDSVRIPQIKKSRPANRMSRAAPQAPESVPRSPEHKVRERSPNARSIVMPPPPLLASVSVGEDPVPMPLTPPEVVPPPVVAPKHAPGFEQGSERVKRERDIAALPVPEVPAVATSPPVSIPMVPAVVTSPPVSIPMVPAVATSPPVSIPMVPVTVTSPPVSIPSVLAAATSPPISVPMVSETQSEPTTLQVKGSSPEKSPYWVDIEIEIDRQWVVSTMPYDPVVLRFRVERTGRVTDLTIEQSSGNDAYDSMAKRAVTAASPFPPFPPTITDDYRVIHHTFRFQPRTSFLRTQESTRS